MPPQRGTSTLARQTTRLQVLLQDIDAEWEDVTRSIQADQQALQALEAPMKPLQRLLTPTPGAASDISPVLAAHLKARALMVSELRETIHLKEQQRHAYEQHFDLARFALAAIQRQAVQGVPAQDGSRPSSVICALACIRRRFWNVWHSSGKRNERVSNRVPYRA